MKPVLLLLIPSTNCRIAEHFSFIPTRRFAGQVIGEHIRQDDLLVNVTKTKKLTNIRAAGSDEKIFITPAVKFSLEEAMEFIAKDEYLEVTPRSLRIRKILLDEHERKRASR